MALEKLQVKIGGMACSFCVETIKKGLGRTDGVAEVNVSLAHEEALIAYDPSRVTATTLTDTLRSLGYTARDPNKVRTFEEEEAELERARDRLIVGGAAAWIGFMVMLLMWVGRHHPLAHWFMAALALTIVFGPGLYILRIAWASVRRRILNQHVLMEIAAFAGLAGGAIGLYNPVFRSYEFFGVSVFVAAYHILGGYTSLLVRTRASQAVKKLLSLRPPTARVVRGGVETEIPIAEVRKDDLVRVRPGEQVPVDGVVVEGASAVNESLVTGEPLPREKLPGHEVIGGSINQSGTLLVRVTRVGEESFLEQVARHIQEARALKPGILLLLDRILTYFVPGVLAVALLASGFWTFGAWALWGAPDWERAVLAALAVLVMGYPCALGMATPLAMIRGGGEAARQGILMRSAASFQTFKDVTVAVLDKTGTITHGEPRVVEIVPAHGFSADSLLALAASAEQVSEHPVAHAVVKAAQAKELRLEPVEEFEAVPGKGVRARVAGKPVLVGTLRFLEESGIETGFAQPVAKREERAQTVVLVGAESRAAGFIALADTVKPDAANAIARFRAAGIEPVMITGDNQLTARAVAEQVGIDRVMAQVLPQDKAAHVRELQRQGKRVAMIGDGINDAPALMQADVGLAIGAGTDIAIESADVVLVGERLTAAVDAYQIARRTYGKTVQNLSLAFAFNGIGVPLATTGLVMPVWAMIAMAASVTTVLLNSFWGAIGPTAQGPPEPKLEQMTLTVPSIHCTGCVTKIRDELSKLPVVVAVDGDPASKQVVVTMRNGHQGRATVEEAITRLGHVVGEK